VHHSAPDVSNVLNVLKNSFGPPDCHFSGKNRAREYPLIKFSAEFFKAEHSRVRSIFRDRVFQQNILETVIPGLTADRPVSDWFLSFSYYLYKNDIRAGNAPYQAIF
jgi:hypothetical protein